MTFLFQIFRPNTGKTIFFSFYSGACGGGGGGGGGGYDEAQQNIYTFFLLCTYTARQGKSINLTHPSCSQGPQNEGDSFGMFCKGILPDCPYGYWPQISVTGIGVKYAIHFFTERRKIFLPKSHTLLRYKKGKTIIAKTLFSLGPHFYFRENMVPEVKLSSKLARTHARIEF